MASTYSFRLATPDDEAGLREVLHHVALPGRMELLSLREPDFFRAERLGNDASQVIACVDGRARVVGFGVRSTRPAWVNGRLERVAYLGMLRAEPGARSGTLLARGYRFLRELDDSDPVRVTFTSILDDNHAAAALLTSGRAGLPRYEPVGALRTWAIGLRRARRAADGTVGGDTLGAEAVAAALATSNARAQFGAYWSADDLAGRSGRMDGFRLADLRAAQGSAGITATLGVWDVAAAKQTIVSRYRWPLTWYQPLSALAGRAGLGPALPRAGAPLRLLYGCCVSGTPERASEFTALLDDVLARWSGRGFDYLMLGLPAGHALESHLAARTRLVLRSTLYAVQWSGAAPHAALDSSAPFPEIVTL